MLARATPAMCGALRCATGRALRHTGQACIRVQGAMAVLTRSLHWMGLWLQLQTPCSLSGRLAHKDDRGETR